MPHVTAAELITPDSMQMARELSDAAFAHQGSSRREFLDGSATKLLLTFQWKQFPSKS